MVELINWLNHLGADLPFADAPEVTLEIPTADALLIPARLILAVRAAMCRRKVLVQTTETSVINVNRYETKWSLLR